MKVSPINNINFNQIIKVRTQLKNNNEKFYGTPKQESYKELNHILNGANKTDTYNKEQAQNIKNLFSWILVDYNKKENAKFIQAPDSNCYLLSGKDIKKTKDLAKNANGANLELTFDFENGKERLSHVTYEHCYTTYHPSQDGFSSDKEICTYVPESYQHVHYLSLDSDI